MPLAYPKWTCGIDARGSFQCPAGRTSYTSHVSCCHSNVAAERLMRPSHVVSRHTVPTVLLNQTNSPDDNPPNAAISSFSVHATAIPLSHHTASSIMVHGRSCRQTGMTHEGWLCRRHGNGSSRCIVWLSHGRGGSPALLPHHNPTPAPHSCCSRIRGNCPSCQQDACAPKAGAPHPRHPRHRWCCHKHHPWRVSRV